MHRDDAWDCIQCIREAEELARWLLLIWAGCSWVYQDTVYQRIRLDLTHSGMTAIKIKTMNKKSISKKIINVEHLFININQMLKNFFLPNKFWVTSPRCIDHAYEDNLQMLWQRWKSIPFLQQRFSGMKTKRPLLAISKVRYQTEFASSAANAFILCEWIFTL